VKNSDGIWKSITGHSVLKKYPNALEKIVLYANFELHANL